MKNTLLGVLVLLSASGAFVPTARAATIDVRDCGAVGDGKTLDTAALQKAVDQAAAAGRSWCRRAAPM